MESSIQMFRGPYSLVSCMLCENKAGDLLTTSIATCSVGAGDDPRQAADPGSASAVARRKGELPQQRVPNSQTPLATYFS